MRRLRRRVLRAFGRAQRPAAWCLLAGYTATFAGVLIGVIATGELKLLTLLVTAGLVNDGIAAVQEVENDLDSEASSDGGATP